MNELVIVPILAVIFAAMCIVAGIVENASTIRAWLYDVGTAYCKWRHHRKRKGPRAGKVR